MSTPPEPPLVPPSQPLQPPQPYQDVQQATVPQSGPAYPYAAPAWPQPPAYIGWAQPQPGAAHDPEATLRKARTALGWAIGAAVGAFLALVLSAVAFVLSGVGADEFDDGMFYESVRGEVVGLPEGSALSGDRLEVALGNVLLDYYGGVDDLTCPDTASVGPSSTVVCTAELDGFEWTGVVFFEDTEGSFVVLEL